MAIVFHCLMLVLPLLPAADWPQFRGLNGVGVGDAASLPAEVAPAKNVAWKVELPPGHSSPIVSKGRIFLTAVEGGARVDAGRQKVVDEGGRLVTLALDVQTGKLLWKQAAPRPRLERYQPTNSPASPTPASDGENVYVFFGDYGLISYSHAGKERWKVPLGPFNNVNGHGSSPIVFDDLVVLVCDQDTDSYMLALDRNTGRVRWKVPRPEVTRSYVTPAVYRPASGPAQLIVPGAFQVIAYYAATGEKAWWVRGFSWQPKSVPVVDGDRIYVHSWEGGGEAETPTETPDFAATLRTYDADKNRRLEEGEFASDPRMQKSFYTLDLDGSGWLSENEWDYYRAKRSSRNTLHAIRGGGKGDVTTTHVDWSMMKFLPNCPSPLLYQGVLYLIKDGGILTAVDPATGKISKQGRLPGAVDTYYASPVAGDGKLYFVSQQGKVTVVQAGADWKVLSTSDFEEEMFATPAIAADALFVRTRSALFCFRSPR
ncbi:MAG: PQQ-binding-like beta-propeller repeat protein [Bryobacterales bacterium]|nr:PQQ-binding-like beta-propeller repeat protein [Bryobacterales bacterium]